MSNCTATNPTHHGENNTLERMAVEEDMEKVHQLPTALVIHVQILQRGARTGASGVRITQCDSKKNLWKLSQECSPAGALPGPDRPQIAAPAATPRPRAGSP